LVNVEPLSGNVLVYVKVFDSNSIMMNGHGDDYWIYDRVANIRMGIGEFKNYQRYEL